MSTEHVEASSAKLTGALLVALLASACSRDTVDVRPDVAARAVPWVAPSSSEPAPAMPGPLAIRIELPREGAAGVVVMDNVGTTPLRLWQPGNSWGDGALSFVVSGPAGPVRYRPSSACYTRNVPLSRELLPGESLRWSFDLRDIIWDHEGAGDPLALPGSSLVALYESGASPEASVHHLWPGQARSAPVTLVTPRSP